MAKAKAPTTKPQPATLKCRSCRRRWRVEEVFDNCSVSWPNQRWVSFQCPRCHRYAHVELAGSRVTIGDIDGAPGPCFIPDNSVTRPGLSFVRSDAGITARIGRRRWSFKAK